MSYRQNLSERTNIKVAHTAVPLQRYSVVSPKSYNTAPIHMKDHKHHVNELLLWWTRLFAPPGRSGAQGTY